MTTLDVPIEAKNPAIGQLDITAKGTHVVFGADRLYKCNLTTGTVTALSKAFSSRTPRLDIAMSAAVAPDGSAIVSGHGDGEILLWKPGKPARRLGDYNDYIWSLAITPDGSRVAAATASGSVSVFDLESGAEVSRFRGHGEYFMDEFVWSVAVAPDGSHAVSTGYLGEVCVWDLSSAEEIVRFEGDSGFHQAAVFTPDGSRIVCAAERGVHVWDLASGEEISQFCDRGAAPLTVAVTPDGRRAVTGDCDADVRLWDLDSGAEVAHLGTHEGNVVLSVVVTPDASRVISSGEEARLYLWDLPSPNGTTPTEQLPTMAGLCACVPAGRAAFSRHGGILRPTVCDVLGPQLRGDLAHGDGTFVPPTTIVGFLTSSRFVNDT